MQDTRRSFYQMTYKASGNPIYIEDMGHNLSISGILLEGMDTHILVLTPGANEPTSAPPIIRPTIEEWSELLRMSDDPKIFETDATGTIKAIHRKSERAISGVIQQQIWRRDGYVCMYCGREMGDVQLTVDHWHPADMGGVGSPNNLLSACRACNKRKGNILPKDYCKANGLDYTGICAYLDGKASKRFIEHLRE